MFGIEKGGWKGMVSRSTNLRQQICSYESTQSSNGAGDISLCLILVFKELLA